MSVIVGFYRGGIIIAEAPTTVAPEIAKVIHDGIAYGTEVFSQQA
jgi:hypothetical protein